LICFLKSEMLAFHRMSVRYYLIGVSFSIAALINALASSTAVVSEA